MMLSLQHSAIERRRQMHRRQNSTPIMFEPAKVLDIPPTHRTTNHRRGISLEPPNTFGQPRPQDPPQQRAPRPLPQQVDEVPMVSITNPSGPRQHTQQETQQARLAQPGTPQYPQTPTRSRQPSEQEINDLKKHIQAVYGGCGTVFVNILPTPVATPQKPAPLPPSQNFDLAPMPSSFGDINGINLDVPSPMSHGLPLSLERSDSDFGYESSYYSSDAHSPVRSPSLQPQQPRQQPTLAEPISFGPPPQITFTESPTMLPVSDNSQISVPLLEPPSSPAKSPRSPRTPRSNSLAEIARDAIIEETGIAPEEVQQYISEQNTDGRWTCLFPECGKTFGRRENIRSHVQTHLGDRQFRCRHCNKCFVRQHDLKRHAKIHSGVKPFRCPCGGDFARQDALTRHRQRGMCVGAFPNCVRKSAPRGRPKKNRPEMCDRLEKSRKSRKANASSSGSSNGGSSPASGEDMFSPITDAGSSFDSSSFRDPFEDVSPQLPSHPYTPPTSPPSNGSCGSGLGVDDMFTNMMSTTSLDNGLSSMGAPDMGIFSGDPFIANSCDDAWNQDMAWMDAL